ncbi:MAG: BatD family protein [Kangiellaceae bacterium]|jgi:hypothetical protein|nr:BatD family protein [Kangiellaceae bacterium]
MKYITLLFLLTSTLAQAAIKAAVDRQEIHANETFTLVVELDEYTSSTPDLSVLPRDIIILGTSKYHRSSTINGVQKTQLGWKIQLMVKEPGVYTIPAITVDKQATQPVMLKVKETTDTFDSGEELKAIMLKSEVNKSEIYVQEQLLLKVKLYRSVQTQYASLTEPQIDDVLIEKVGDDKQYESTIDGKRYWILERQYAIFPQTSENFTIPKIVFNADVVDRRSNSYGRMLGRTKPVSIAADEIKVSVKPFPNNHQGTWLPGRDLTIESYWADTKEKIVGEPSTWTITIKGNGLHENQLPELILPKVDGLKWYPDTAEKSRTFNSDGIIGQRTERIAVVPTKDGDLRLPELSFKWFNTETEQYEVATLPAQSIYVQPSQNQTQFIPTITQTVSEPSAIAESSNINYWQLSTLLLSLLWIVTILFFGLRKPTYSYATNRSKTTPTVTDSYKQVLQAISEKNNARIYSSVVTWLNEKFGTRALADHVKAFDDKLFKVTMLKLERSLFAQPSDNWSDYAQIKMLVKKYNKQVATQPNSENELRSLYPN